MCQKNLAGVGPNVDLVAMPSICLYKQSLPLSSHSDFIVVVAVDFLLGHFQKNFIFLHNKHNFWSDALMLEFDKKWS